jgi:hypothetical protein
MRVWAQITLVSFSLLALGVALYVAGYIAGSNAVLHP